MAAPAMPYNIILAGKYGVGKSSLFTFLSSHSRRSIRGWDKYTHVMNVGSDDVQVVLWDTASMEKNSVLSMSRSYFSQCAGVILVYKKGDLGSLLELDKWWQVAQDGSQWSRSLIFSLWCNDMDSYSDDEIEPGQREIYLNKWKIPPELVFDVCAAEDDGDNVKECYRRVVRAVWEKCQGTATTVSSTASQASTRRDTGNKIVLPDTTNNDGNNQPTNPVIARRKCFCAI